jgi:hypothetical protein
MRESFILVFVDRLISLNMISPVPFIFLKITISFFFFPQNKNSVDR